MLCTEHGQGRSEHPRASHRTAISLIIITVCGTSLWKQLTSRERAFTHMPVDSLGCVHQADFILRGVSTCVARSNSEHRRLGSARLLVCLRPATGTCNKQASSSEFSTSGGSVSTGHGAAGNTEGPVASSGCSRSAKLTSVAFVLRQRCSRDH